MKKIFSLAIMLMAFVGFTSCDNDNDSTLVLEKTSWEGQEITTDGNSETIISYKACFTSNSEGVEVQHLLKKEGGHIVTDFKIYSPFTYQFNGRGGSLHYTTAIADNDGAVYHRKQLPDANIVYHDNVLKAYTNLPCHQVTYAPIQVPELTVPDSEYPDVQGSNMQLAIGTWTCKSPSVKLVLDPTGNSSYTVNGVVLAEGNMEIDGTTIRINGKSIYVVYITNTVMYITDFAGNILSLKRSLE